MKILIFLQLQVPLLRLVLLQQVLTVIAFSCVALMIVTLLVALGATKGSTDAGASTTASA